MTDPNSHSGIESPSPWQKLRDCVPTLTRTEQAAVFNEMRNNSRAKADFYVMILLSAAIAFYGLLQNSVAVIIGAMLVAPLMSPMIAIGHGIVMGNMPLLRRAAISTVSGMIVAVTSATLLTLSLPHLEILPTSEEILARTNPNILDQYIALVSGAAAAYALSRKRVAAALPGVAIAAALVPPLCVVGYGIGTQQWQIASGALILFLTNLAAIVFASAGVFMLLGFRPTRIERNENQRRGAILATIGMIAITVPLVISTAKQLDQYHAHLAVKSTIKKIIPTHLARVDNLKIRFRKKHASISFVAYQFAEQDGKTERRTSQQQIMDALQEQLERNLEQPFTLQAIIVDATRLKRASNE